ncbi:hypothetical protein [Nonomuraea sp. NPDC050783]|uniref:hypothetical protein n=1 Tax=Nonomuraea sp. NPDC050783 TaxID=3154634 RepID=UPI003465A756
MRFVVELEHGPDGVHGRVTREGSDRPEPFHGWLELLRLLEPPDVWGNPWDDP